MARGTSRGSVEIELVALGDVHIKRRLLRFSERAINPTPVWGSIFEFLMMVERVQFLTEGAHGSGGWARLADSTVIEKARKGLPPWIERASNTLFRSLTEPLAPGQIHDVAFRFMRFGSEVPYGIFPQRGTVKMPQRKIIDLKLSERQLIVKQIQRFILTGEVEPMF